MFVLDTTTRTLEVLLDAAPATNQLPVVVTYADVAFGGATPYTPASSNTLTSGVTAVTAAAAPAAGVQRQVEELTVRNDDTAARVVTLRYNDNGTFRRVVTATLQAGETLEYTHAAGLRTLADGAVKMQWTAPGISQGGGFVRVNVNGSVEASPAAGQNTTLDSGDLLLPSAGRLGWSTDAFLQRDGAGLLSQRNGTAGQEHRVYRTYTDASNGEWAALRWNGIVLEMGSYANGTGTVRNIIFKGAAMGIGPLLTSAPFTVSGPPDDTFAGSLHIRPPAGRRGYITFTEDAVADRGAVGFEAGSGTMSFYTGGTFSAGTARLGLTAAGSAVLGSGALATNAADGFLYVATCAGAPTGTPTAFTGRVPLVYDTTNHKLWAYDGAAWKGVVLA